MQEHSEERVDKDKRSRNGEMTAAARKRKYDWSRNGGIPHDVSSWTRSTTEELGIVYDSKAISISDLFKISSDSPYFVYPFDEDNQKLLGSLVEVTKRKMHRARNPGLSGSQTVKLVAEIEHCQDILDGLMEESNEDEESDPHILWYNRRSHYSLEIFIMQLQQLCIRRKQGQELCGQDFTELLAKFTRIFLLNESMAVRERSLGVGGVVLSGVPDLYFWTRIPESSIATVTVPEVKPALTQLMPDTDSFEISTAVSSPVLGQHAGQLLLGLSDSAFPNVSLGMICQQTTIIFTYLEIAPEHVAVIQENGAVNCRMEFNGRQSGRINYTRPYNYLKEADRNEILEFLFWLGLHSLPGCKRPNVKHKRN